MRPLDHVVDWWDIAEAWRNAGGITAAELDGLADELGRMSRMLAREAEQRRRNMTASGLADLRGRQAAGRELRYCTHCDRWCEDLVGHDCTRVRS